MKPVKLTAILICVFFLFGSIPISGNSQFANAQSPISEYQIKNLKRIQKHRIFDKSRPKNDKSVLAPCHVNGESNYRPMIMRPNGLPPIMGSHNWDRCTMEGRLCADDGILEAAERNTRRYKTCISHLWRLVEAENWTEIATLKDRYRRNDFRFDNSGSDPQPFKSSTLSAGGIRTNRYDYGTDIDDLDASGIEILDVVEGEAKPSNDITKSCLCYAGDFENLGICHSSDPNSPNYNKRNAQGELISTYPTGEYPWTAACKHPVGGQVNLREWHKNYNENRR